MPLSTAVKETSVPPVDEILDEGTVSSEDKIELFGRQSRVSVGELVDAAAADVDKPVI